MLYFNYVLFVSALFTLFSSRIFAQRYDNSISGYVINDSTLEAIENANVYISNTTFGSSTDKEGYYIIKSIPPNIHDLIVSSIGYKTVEFKIDVKKNSQIEKKIQLKPIIYEAQAIDITSTTPDEWLKNLEIFKNVYLGKTFRAENCTFENAEVLEFNESASILMAASQNPLIIRNNILGFKVHCAALSFSYDMGRNTWRWSIKPRYEELVPQDSLQAHVWEINRQIAYFGSMYHFFMSLKQNKLSDDGYEIFTTAVPNVNFPTMHNNIFLALRDSILRIGIAEDYHTIHFNKYLMIRNYTIEEHFPQYVNLNVQFGNTYQNSCLKLIYGEITLDEYGYPVEENAFEVNGYWATLGIADLLPRYFKIKHD